MGINFRTESFRDDFTFRNSPEHIRRFPFPFHEDSYMYAVNIEPHVVGAKCSVLENLMLGSHGGRGRLDLEAGRDRFDELAGLLGVDFGAGAGPPG